ncbi:peptidase, S8/S53 family [Schaalia dentiphila ATCC 17982]|uniref:Peptidase, S8/S53 family n=2 Tax=Schaalia TaxID=2529408 RepID=A7BBP7_9ACTO|nr:peptidase, S8/S53 family [Schaalia odontolytica ATCC 17982]
MIMTHAQSCAQPAPRSPFGFVGRAGRAARALTTAASALALTVGALAVSPVPAHAADPITTQEYFSYYHLDSARQKGYTGKGITIALIDTPVDLSDPELAGANIVDKSRCTLDASPTNSTHGNSMAALLVSQKYGVAPDATLYTYQTATDGAASSGSCKQGTQELDTIANLINQAIDDGAQIISISLSSTDHDKDLKWAITRAVSQGVIIVSSMGNKAADENNAHLAWWSGVVGVSAIHTDGTFASYSSWGNGVVTAAIGGPVTIRSSSSGETTTTEGTSNATALVSGMLALARQKWPDATTNQILQSLVHSGLNPNHEWNKYTGYGAIDGGGLVIDDPSQYPDENPILNKPGGSEPTADEVADYADGLINPAAEREVPDSYVYRGADDQVVLYHAELKTPLHLGTSPRYHRK